MLAYLPHILPIAVSDLTDPGGAAGGGRIDLALMIGAIGLIAAGVTARLTLRHRQRQRQGLRNLARSHHFTPLDAEQIARTVQPALDEIFGPGAVILDAVRKRTRGLTLEVVHYRFPLYRIERNGAWDPRTQEADQRMLTLVRDLDAPLPDFRLMPNSWMLKTIGGRRRNIFINVEPFGWYNYVFGRDRDWIRHIFPGEAQHLLRRNTHLAIDCRRDLIAFYHVDETLLPPDFDRFADQCIELASLLNERGRSWAAGEGRRVQRDVIG